MYKVFVLSLLVALVSSVCLDTNTCGSHGKFLQSGSSYVCLCDNGYSGATCDTFDPCVFSYVVNGGTCTVNPDGTTYTVTCPPNTYGNRCENFVNQCELTPGLCQHGSTCQPYPAGSFTCECATGYYGTNCETMVCQEGFTGENCDVDINECAYENNICMNGGTCVNSYGSWSCTCPEGYTGRNCAYGPGGEGGGEGPLGYKRQLKRRFGQI